MQKIIASIACALCFVFGLATFQRGWTEEPSSTESEFVASEECCEYVVKKLVDNRFSEEGAEAVYRMNCRIFDPYYEDDDLDILETYLSPLYKLGGNRAIQDRLKEFPETATLLALAYDKTDRHPEVILDSLEGLSDDEVDAIESLYGIFIDTDDIAKLANLLLDKNIRKLVAQLLACDDVNYTIVPYFFDMVSYTKGDNGRGPVSNPKAYQVYRGWFLDRINEMIRLSRDEKTDSADLIAYIIYAHSKEIQKNLLEDQFCDNFGLYWHRFQELMKEETTNDESLAAIDPNIWMFLHRYGNDAIPIYRNYNGYAAIILMQNEFFFPENQRARERMVQIMKKEGEKIIHAVLGADIVDENKEFIRDILLRDNLAQEDFEVILYELAIYNQDKNQGHPIDYFCKLKDKDLKKECAGDQKGWKTWVPGYDVYTYFDKKRAGRDTSGLDAVFATLDAAFIVVDVATLGGSKLLTQGVKVGGKVGEKVGEKVIVREVGKQIAEKGIKISGSEICKKVGRRTVLDCVKNFRSTLRQTFKQLGSLDITEFVQSVFKNCPLGRESFKKLTQLDARIFMRGDRRVVLNLADNKISNLFRNLLVDTAGTGAMVTAAGTEAGQAAIATSVKLGRKVWKEHISTWWLMNCAL